MPAAVSSPLLALERRFPTIAGKVPRRPLALLPTPVHPLRDLGRDAGIGDLWIKRDDRTGDVYGGNKVRKLEWLLADAVARGHRSVLTTGALGSNHALATTIYARSLGLNVDLVLIPQPVTAHVRKTLLLDHAFGATIHYAPTIAAARRIAFGVLARGFFARDRRYLVPTGGSSVVGTLGYVNAGLELAEQVAAGELPEPAAVVVPLGSGGTVAGLVAGLKLAGLASRVIAVRVTDLLPPTSAFLTTLELGPDDFTIRSDWLGPGYGAVTEAGLDASRRSAEHEGLKLETTYGAKALAGALALAHEPEWRGRPILFWHTYSSADPSAHVARLPAWRELPPALHFVWRDAVTDAEHT
jgi:D-cysteine desulfhydrase